MKKKNETLKTNGIAPTIVFCELVGNHHCSPFALGHLSWLPWFKIQVSGPSCPCVGVTESPAQGHPIQGCAFHARPDVAGPGARLP